MMIYEGCAQSDSTVVIMADETPQPLPGIELVPRLLAYEIARQCEQEAVKGIISVIMNEDETWSVRVSSGVQACEVAFAASILTEDALRVSKDGDGFDFPEDAEEDTDPVDEA